MKQYYILAAQSDPERNESVICLNYDEARGTAEQIAKHFQEPWCIYCKGLDDGEPCDPFQIINEKGEVIRNVP